MKIATSLFLFLTAVPAWAQQSALKQATPQLVLEGSLLKSETLQDGYRCGDYFRTHSDRAYIRIDVRDQSLPGGQGSQVFWVPMDNIKVNLGETEPRARVSRLIPGTFMAELFIPLEIQKASQCLPKPVLPIATK